MVGYGSLAGAALRQIKVKAISKFNWTRGYETGSVDQHAGIWTMQKAYPACSLQGTLLQIAIELKDALDRNVGFFLSDTLKITFY